MGQLIFENQYHDLDIQVSLSIPQSVEDGTDGAVKFESSRNIPSFIEEKYTF